MKQILILITFIFSQQLMAKVVDFNALIQSEVQNQKETYNNLNAEMQSIELSSVAADKTPVIYMLGAGATGSYNSTKKTSYEASTVVKLNTLTDSKEFVRIGEELMQAQ